VIYLTIQPGQLPATIRGRFLLGKLSAFLPLLLALIAGCADENTAPAGSWGPEWQPVLNAEVSVEALSGVEIPIAAAVFLAATAEAGPGTQLLVKANVSTPPDSREYCLVRVSDKFATDRVAEGTAPGAVLLPGDSSWRSIVTCGDLHTGAVVNQLTSAMVDVLGLYAPLDSYGAAMPGLLNLTAASLLTDLSHDIDGSGAIGYTELLQAPPAVLAGIPTPLAIKASREAVASSGAGMKRAPPNIVFILADDLGYGDVSHFWEDSEIDTPNIDAIAREGIALTNFHVDPICSSSRAALLSGLYTVDVRVPGQDGPAKGGITRTAALLPEFLGQAGYRTAAFGKWHLSQREGYRPFERGFERWLGFYGGASYYQFSQMQSGRKTHFYQGTQRYEQKEGHITDLIADSAIAFIEDNRDQPFFAYLSFNAVHTPLWNPEHRLHAAREDWLERVASSGVKDRARQDYIAVVRHMDQRIGDVLARIDALGLSANTLVIVASDNGAPTPTGTAERGIGSNALYRDGKGSPFEGGIRTPFVARWPGVIPPGRQSDEFTMHVDLWPTLREVAGLYVPADNGTRALRGNSLLPLLKGEGALDSHSREGFFAFVLSGTALVAPPWKLVTRWLQGGEVEELLFNIEQDPYESMELSADQQAVYQRLRERRDEILNARMGSR
jgi:arylsulfatase A-like enzyme